MVIERTGERVPGGIPHGLCNQGAVCIVDGKRMGLCVFEVLQPMLEIAQKNISLAQLRFRVLLYQSLSRQRRQHFEGGSHAQAGVAPAAYELKGLRNELDLADASRTEFDVIGQFAARHLRPDLSVQVAHCGECPVVEVFAEHERAHDRRERSGLVACERASLYPGIALPFAPLGHQVLLESVKAGGERSGIAPRSQAHVYPEYPAVGGRFGQSGDQPAAQAREEFVVADGAGAACRSAPGFSFFRIEENEIDVG